MVIGFQVHTIKPDILRVRKVSKGDDGIQYKNYRKISLTGIKIKHLCQKQWLELEDKLLSQQIHPFTILPLILKNTLKWSVSNTVWGAIKQGAEGEWINCMWKTLEIGRISWICMPIKISFGVFFSLIEHLCILMDSLNMLNHLLWTLISDKNSEHISLGWNGLEKFKNLSIKKTDDGTLSIYHAGNNWPNSPVSSDGKNGCFQCSLPVIRLTKLDNYWNNWLRKEKEKAETRVKYLLSIHICWEISEIISV